MTDPFPSAEGVEFELLDQARRRETVRELATCDTTVALDELAEAVAARVADDHVDEPPGDAVSEMATLLYHCDLPKLSAWGAVEFDVDAKTVHCNERLDVLAEFLQELQTQ